MNSRFSTERRAAALRRALDRRGSGRRPFPARPDGDAAPMPLQATAGESGRTTLRLWLPQSPRGDAGCREAGRS